MKMKKNIGISIATFFGFTAVIALLHLIIEEFELDDFAESFTNPIHLVLTVVCGVIVAVCAFKLLKIAAENNAAPQRA